MRRILFLVMFLFALAFVGCGKPATEAKKEEVKTGEAEATKTPVVEVKKEEAKEAPAPDAPKAE